MKEAGQDPTGKGQVVKSVDLFHLEWRGHLHLGHHSGSGGDHHMTDF